VILKALEKRPADRYQTAAQLRDDLRHLERIPDLPPLSAEATRSRRRWIWGAVVASLLLTATLGAYWRDRRQQRQDLPEQGSIVLADFTNTTGDAVFDQTLSQALHVQLEQSPFLSIVPEGKVAQQLRVMRRTQDASVTKDVAREVCVRTASKAYLQGSIARVGSQYAIALEAVNCDTGDTLAAEQAEANSREQVLRALDQAATKLRGKLGESLARIQQYGAPVEQVTTSSLEALKAYSLGSQVKYSANLNDAVPFFQRAIDLDPQFAMAYAQMGSIYLSMHQVSLATKYLGKAYELRHSVSDRETLAIQARYYFGAGDFERAIPALQQWARTYPPDPAPHTGLGLVYQRLGQYQRFLEKAKEALRLDPTSSNACFNLALALYNLGQFDEVSKLIKQAEAQNLSSGRFGEFLYFLAFERKDTAAMERELVKMVGQPGEQGLRLSIHADTEASYGRLEKARQFNQKAIDSARHNGDGEAAAGYELALHQAEFGFYQGARRDAAAALTPGSGKSVRTLGALALALAGERERPESIAQQLSKQCPRDMLLQSYWLPTIRAAVALNHDNPARALELLEPSTMYELGTPEAGSGAVFYPVYLRGIAHLANGQPSQALVEFQKILSHPGIVGNYPLRPLAQLWIARSLAAEAGLPFGNAKPQNLQLASMTRDALDKAREADERFFALWKDADEDIPILQQAHREYESISQDQMTARTLHPGR
jgi:eukaryotic-like serine/threonine-protein kinase